MTLAYVLRLALFSMSAFVLTHAIVGAILTMLSRPLVGIARNLRARDGANLLFVLRLLPSILAAYVIAALCVPAYLRFESPTSNESVNAAGLAGAALFLSIWTGSLWRASVAILRSWRFGRSLSSTTPHTVIGMAGLVKPRLVISQNVIGHLSPDELAAAIRHEEAHRTAFDNWKRLAILATPVVLPFCNPFRILDAARLMLAEWAADDEACGGEREALHLASALVRVASMGPAAAPPALVTSLIGDGDHLSHRVNRLLNPRPHPPRRTLAMLYVSSAALLGVIAFSSNNALLRAVHEALEHLAR